DATALDERRRVGADLLGEAEIRVVDGGAETGAAERGLQEPERDRRPADLGPRHQDERDVERRSVVAGGTRGPGLRREGLRRERARGLDRAHAAASGRATVLAQAALRSANRSI